MSSTTRFSGTADRVWIEGEENGWELVVDTPEQAYRFNVHGIASSRELSDQLVAILGTLADWRLEGEQAAHEWQTHLDQQAAEEARDRMVGDVPSENVDAALRFRSERGGPSA